MAKRKKKKSGGKKPKDERRSFPRVSTEHSVELVSDEGGVFPAIALDLSLSGMQLLCDQPTAEKILADGKAGAGTEPKYVNVRMRFRTADGGQVRVQVNCEIMASREASKDDYRLGLRFVEFLADSYTDLESYIDEIIDLPD